MLSPTDSQFTSDIAAPNQNTSPRQSKSPSSSKLKNPQKDDPTISLNELELPDCSFKVAVVEDSNLKYRQSMEDAHVYIYNYCDIPDAGYFAVFDGHAGSQAAKWCSENLHDLVRTNILQNDDLLPSKSCESGSHETMSNRTSQTSFNSSTQTPFSPNDGLNNTSSAEKMDDLEQKLARSSSQSSTTSQPSSPSPAFDQIYSPRKPIAKEERVPLAFRSAFVDADSLMSKAIPAHTGTTAAVAVIRWEHSIQNFQNDHSNKSPSSSRPTNDEKSLYNTAKPASIDNSNTTVDHKVSSQMEGLSLAGKMNGTQNTDSPLVDSGASVHISYAPPDAYPAVDGANSKLETTSKRNSDLFAKSHRKSRPNSGCSTGSASQPDLNGSVPLSKPKTNISTASRSSFPRPVASGSRKRYLYSANVGDSRIVLCRAGRALRLTYDHKGSDEAERARIIRTGGLMLGNRVNGMLAVTRSLGDGYMKSVVTGFPYTTRTLVTPEDEFFIIACDGIWDVFTDSEAVSMIRGIMDPKEAAKVLVNQAIDAYSTDNITCMVVRLDPTVFQD